ncbi:interleukin-22 receptor subunit alpha-2 [Dunckerocampus dactyliophorus]|uniref:interleukin-22 receptor subunit alpha-2 n=1 Tax=Dunckerocampus dactyliophorus TaxID=161453 RepID=UPI002405BD2D|nr:interleukin-22 receptor subunit alpha-2 [Dunckerocampus dactyliophorus]
MNLLLVGVVLLVDLLAAQVSLSPPAQVTFESVDFNNILRWTASTDDSDRRYHVQWKIYGASEWKDVDHCHGIPMHHCDVSNVTSDLREWYYARLRASSSSSTSAWVLSPRFNPRWDTKISAPLLRLNVTERGIVVRVRTPPLLAGKIQSSLLYRSLLYRIYLVQPSGKEEVFEEIVCCAGKLLVTKVKHKSKYCLQVQTINRLQGRSSARGPRKCITTL